MKHNQTTITACWFTVGLSHLLLPFLEVEHSLGDGLRDELQLLHLGFQGAQLLQLLQLTS